MAFHTFPKSLWNIVGCNDLEIKFQVGLRLILKSIYLKAPESTDEIASLTFTEIFQDSISSILEVILGICWP